MIPLCLMCFIPSWLSVFVFLGFYTTKLHREEKASGLWLVGPNLANCILHIANFQN